MRQAQKLSRIFDFIDEVPAVYLFDEFDAIGAQRGMENEVGEQRRILNTFLQLLERDSSDSFIDCSYKCNRVHRQGNVPAF